MQGSLVYNFEYAVWETVNGYDNIFVESTFQSNQIESAARAAGIASGDPCKGPQLLLRDITLTRCYQGSCLIVGTVLASQDKRHG